MEREDQVIRYADLDGRPRQCAAIAVRVADHLILALHPTSLGSRAVPGLRPEHRRDDRRDVVSALGDRGEAEFSGARAMLAERRDDVAPVIAAMLRT